MTATPTEDEFGAFARAQVETGDIDPAYPVLREVYRADGLGDRSEAALWRTLLYVTWYDLGTAAEVWTGAPVPRGLLASEFARPPRTGTERRGHRGAPGLRIALRQIDSVLALAASFGGLSGWVQDAASARGAMGWNRVAGAFMGASGNGPWAGWKWADLLAHVHGIDIEPATIGLPGHALPSGPAKGLRAVGGGMGLEALSVSALSVPLDALARRQGIERMDQMETALCDFGSLASGRYYVGHDIDLQQEQLRGLPGAFWRARELCFSASVRGEASGWDGVRPERRGVYRDTRRILMPAEAA